jgi:hypothetical protein
MLGRSGTLATALVVSMSALPPAPPHLDSHAQPSVRPGFRWQVLLRRGIQWLAGGFLLYRLKSILGINLAAHHHAVELFWQPHIVIQDIIRTQLS